MGLSALDDPTPIENRLMEARSGSTEALGEVLETCRAYLLAVANRDLDPRLQAKGGASDLVQQTYLEAQQSFGQFQGSTETELRQWLRTLLKNNVANFGRHWRDTQKRAVEREVSLEGENPADPGLTPSREMMGDERRTLLRAAIASLPEDYRLILTLRYEEGLPFEEAAQRMGRSADALRKLWARAIDRLQEKLEEGT